MGRAPGSSHFDSTDFENGDFVIGVNKASLFSLNTFGICKSYTMPVRDLQWRGMNNVSARND